MYKLFLCLRYLRKRRIAFFAVGAVCLCVAMVLIVFSVMDGFLQMVKDRSRGMLGDLVMENGALQGFPFYQEFIDEISNDPEIGPRIHQATPVIISYGVIQFPEGQVTKPVQILGIRLEETYEVNDFKKGLFYEKHYPGTTTLGEQLEPRYGLDANGKLVLPPELEAARSKWESTATPQEIKDAWRSRLWRCTIQAGDFPRQLNRRKISDGLKQAFAQRGCKLPSDAQVAVVMKSIAWRIDFGEDSYLVRLEDGDLYVFQGEYPGPGYYLPIPLERRAESTQPIWTGPELPGAILGTDLCARRERSGEYERRHYRGELVDITMVPMGETGRIASGSGAMRKRFHYVDDCRTGVYDIDSMSVYLDFDVLQPLLEMHEFTDDLPLEDGQIYKKTYHARATQVQIKLTDGSDPIKTRELIEKRWDRFHVPRLSECGNPALLTEVTVKTWEEKQARFIAAVEKEKYLVTILFGIISVVAVLLVGCIFYMIVQQKTRDIGIVKSVGASSLGIANIFITYGAAVGVVGGALGIVIGVFFVRYINEIQDLLIEISPKAQIWNPEVYTFDRIPSEINPVNAVIIYLVAIVASMAGSLIAATRAARVWPVEALRYE